MLSPQDKRKILNFVRKHPLGVSINEIIAYSRKNNKHVRKYIEQCEQAGLLSIDKNKKKFSVTAPSDETSYDFLMHESGMENKFLRLITQLTESFPNKTIQGKKRKDFVDQLSEFLINFLNTVQEYFFFSIRTAFGNKVSIAAKIKLHEMRKLLSRIFLKLAKIDEKLTKEVIEKMALLMNPSLIFSS